MRCRVCLPIFVVRQSELVSFLEERVHILEGETEGTVPAAALLGAEKALAETMAEVIPIV